MTLPVAWPWAVSVRGLVMTITDVVFVAAALAWVRAVANGSAALRWSPFYVPLGLYVATMLLSIPGSVEPMRSGLKLGAEIYLLGLAVLTVNLATSAPLVRLAMKAWLLGALATVVAGLLGVALFYGGLRAPAVNPFLSGFGSLPPGNYPRIVALFTNANALCTFLVISVVFVWTMRALGRLAVREAVVLTGALVLTAFFTLSAGLGGLLLSAGLWGYARSRHERPPARARLLLAGGIVGAALFVVATLVSPVARDARGGLPFEVRPPSRVLAWQSAWQRTWERPLLGRGVGTDAAAVRNRNAAGLEEVVEDAHNTWLNISAQQGIPGALAFAAVMWVLLRGAGPLAATPASPASVTLRTGLVIAVIGGFLYQTLSGSFEDVRHMWVLFGLLAAVKEPLAEA